MFDFERLKDNVSQVQERIAQAAIRSGRQPGEITLVAVTKKVTPEIMEALVSLGIHHIGENRVQDAKEKKKRCQHAARQEWHMIGHLQRNKVKEALKIFDFFHSIASVSLAREISKYAAQVVPPDGSSVPVLLEVNVSGEVAKDGFAPEELEKDMSTLTSLPFLDIQGFMTMAPQTEDMKVCRECFQKLALLRRCLWEKYLGKSPKPRLSMGMSQDFEVAIEEGASWVRIGSALFQGIIKG